MNVVKNTTKEFLKTEENTYNNKDRSLFVCPAELRFGRKVAVCLNLCTFEPVFRFLTKGYSRVS